LSKTLSGESATASEQEKVSPLVTKAKPQVPARPGQSSKIANLRGNFMNDLNQKLGLGPPKEKEPEPEPVIEEVKPLEDARKGRARGPQRRAPAKSPAAPMSSVSITACDTVEYRGTASDMPAEIRQLLDVFTPIIMDD
jgi:hypothetical protein